MNIKERHVWIFFLILIILASFFINFNVATPTPIIFGDEGYYASRGLWVLENLEIPKYWNVYSEDILFRYFWLDVPLSILTISSFFSIGGEILVKSMNPILSILTGIMTFLLAKKMYSGKTGVLGMFFFLVLPCIITYTVFLYADMLLTLLMVSSLFFLLKAVKEDSGKYLVFSGIFGGLASLTKETGLLIVLLYLIVFLYYRKDWIKKFGVLVLMFLVFMAPWYGLHHYVLLGNPGLPVIENYFPKNWYSPEIEVIGEQTLEIHQSGTYAGIFQYGILNYVQFSYGLGMFVFMILGISCMLYRKEKVDLLILSWTFVLFLIIAYYTGGEGKVEALSRWLLPVMPFFAISAGIATEKIYSFLKEYGSNAGKLIAIFFIFVVIVFGLFSANTKAASLKPIKTWSPAFVKGCEWIRINTPEDSDILSIWVHHGMYQCRRDFYWVYLPNKDQIVLYANDTSHELLKDDSIEYVYFQKFSISFEKSAEVYPVEFVEYVKNSDKFEKVYEYPENCMISQGNDCVVVYKIL